MTPEAALEAQIEPRIWAAELGVETSLKLLVDGKLKPKAT
jgi:hypothetical protein